MSSSQSQVEEQSFQLDRPEESPAPSLDSWCVPGTKTYPLKPMQWWPGGHVNSGPHRDPGQALIDSFVLQEGGESPEQFSGHRAQSC